MLRNVNKENDSGADWLAFALQAGFGFVGGALTALYAILRSDLLLRGSLGGWMFGVGCSLIGAGIAGYWGDRFWFSITPNSVRGEWPRHSPVSIALSILMGVAGLALCALSLSLDGGPGD